MFTGIVEELGEIDAIEDQGDAVRLTVRGPLVAGDAHEGDSIAVNGCCLTVVALTRDADGSTAGFTADVMRETLDKTTTGDRRPGDRVNLERAATLATRLGGHLVQGHVDGRGVVRRREPSEHWEIVEIEAPSDLLRYLVPKGSVTVDGVSLTVVDRVADGFTVSLIPETLSRTTLGGRQPGEGVNLETDVIAKHVERLLQLREDRR